MANALLSLQIIPRSGGHDEIIALVDRAIALIDQSGVKYQVGPLGTTMEGELGALVNILRQANEEMVAHGLFAKSGLQLTQRNSGCLTSLNPGISAPKRLFSILEYRILIRCNSNHRICWSR